MNYAHYRLKKFVPEGKLPLGVVYMPPGKNAGKRFHDHNYSEIVLILGGTGVHLCEGRQYPVKAGDILIIHPGSTHAYDHQALELVNIIYDAQQLMLPILDGSSMPLFRKFFPDGQENFCGQAEPLLSLNPEDLKKIFDMIWNMGVELKSVRPGCRLQSLALFIEIIVALCRLYQKNEQTKETPFRIGEAVEYMNIHYQQPISIEQLARKVCMSRRNLFLQFKKTAGCSPIQYLICLRISRATELLLYSELPVGDIAEQCGFSDSNYFCKIFRAQTGMSPRQFRLKNSQ